MTRVRLARTVCALVLTVAACDKNRAPRESIETWTTSASPLLDIGDNESGDIESAGDVVGVARRADGVIIVADRASSSIKFFLPDGALTKQVGRSGNGPGEFVQLSRMIRCGDSLFVFDGGIRQYKVLSLDGRFQRQFAFSGLEARQMAYRTTCNSDGVLVSYAYDLLRDLPARSGITRTLVPYWLSRSDGTLLANLGRFSSSERWATVTDTVSGTGPLPLGKQPVIAIGGSHAYVGLADSFAIDVFSLDGKRQNPIRRANIVRATTAHDIERFKLLDTTGIPSTHIARKVSEWSQMEFAKSLPPYSDLVVDNADNLWIREFPGAADRSAHWIVYSNQQLAIARAELPLMLDVSEIGADFVLGTVTNLETGVKHVQLFALTRPAR